MTSDRPAGSCETLRLAPKPSADSWPCHRLPASLQPSSEPSLLAGLRSVPSSHPEPPTPADFLPLSPFTSSLSELSLLGHHVFSGLWKTTKRRHVSIKAALHAHALLCLVAETATATSKTTDYQWSMGMTGNDGHSELGLHPFMCSMAVDISTCAVQEFKVQL